MNAFSELEQAFQLIQSQLETLANAVGALDQRITDLVNEDIPWLEDDVESLRNRLSDLESRSSEDE